MQKRQFGRTGHQSTIAIFGTAALSKVTQVDADRAVEAIIAAGVNHIDVAPSYGEAELRLTAWLARERQRFFIGCKTMERTKMGARQEMHRSLERLGMDAFDLYQLHAVNTRDELEKALAHDGAIHALVEARAEKLTRYLGITAHGMQAPAVLLQALNEFDFDSVLFPINASLFAREAYRADAVALLDLCRARNVGVMAIKAVAKQPWGDRPRTSASWYEPFAQPDDVQRHVNFTLAQPVTGLCSVSDVGLLPAFIAACEAYKPLNATEQETLIASAQGYEMIFA